MKNLLFISALSSEKLIEERYRKEGKNPGFAVQKFSRLIVKGLIENGVDTTVLSNPGIKKQTNSKLWINLGTETENGVIYKYAPFVNFPVIKHICVFFYVFFYVLIWGMKSRKDKAIVCDVLNISASLGALLASKLNNLTSIAIVTDIYGYMAGKQGLLMSIAAKINSMYVASFDKYVLLTEQMNAIVNPHNHPYVVMEGLCDKSIIDEQVLHVEKDNPSTIIYAGGLHEKYGLKMLVEAFIISGVDATLKIYGDGPYVHTLKDMCKNNTNVLYMGVASNNVVVDDELKATLLVNPRFTYEELAKYSFPSKNMEYMTTGTPLLTTRLPGMPKEYNDYVYLFDEETVDGYARVIREVLSKSKEELEAKGFSARRWVLDKKNNMVQTRKIINLITK